MPSEICPSEDLAYWVGVVQTDGSFKRYNVKSTGYSGYHISLNIAEKSLPMQIKFRDIASRLFGTKSKIFREHSTGRYDFKFSVSRLIPIFHNLGISFGDPPVPPRWCLTSKSLFGAYLAGVIDGDGTVKIHGKRYPQCHIKITSGHEQTELRNSIMNNLDCWAGIYFSQKTSILNGKIINGKSYDLEFYCSSKNLGYFREFILPYIKLKHKKEKIESYIKERWPG